MSNTILSRSETVFTDNGNGMLCVNGRVIAGSRVDYDAGVVYLPKEPLRDNIYSPNYDEFNITDRSPKYTAISGGTMVEKVNVRIQAASTATVGYISAADTRTIDLTIGKGQHVFNVLDGIPKPCMALFNSWAFEISGVHTVERGGTLYQNWDAFKGTGKVVGNMTTGGTVTVLGIAPNVAPNIKVLQGVYTGVDGSLAQKFYGHTEIAPLKLQSFIAYAEVNGKTLIGRSDAEGNITGDLTGKVDLATGSYELDSGKGVAQDTVRYNAVAQVYLPLDSSVIGIDATRLPADGKVPVLHVGDMVVISNHLKHDLGSAHQAGQTVSLPRQNLDRLCITDNQGTHLNAELYDYDLAKGTVTWQTSLDLSAYQLPLAAVCIWEEENRLMGVDINGSLKLQFPISRDYPVDNTHISSAILLGDMNVRASEPFSQAAWTQVWQDTRIGAPILARLNVADYPMTLTSDGAVSERWLLKFNNTTQFELYGERLGLIAEGDIYNDFAPVNPVTKKPYFTLPRAAMTGGFAAQNCVRFNTYGTPRGVWVIRSVQPSAKRQSQKDGFMLCLRGNTVATA